MTSTALALASAPASVDVEVVVPVHNEEAGLAASVRRLHAHLSSDFDWSWRIVIADNASTDDTPRIARALAAELDGVDVLRLGDKGRGRALRAAWSTSRARVACYMDVDLSTDLKALPPLVAPLLSGHSDIAIGTRLGRGAQVVRGPKRELISRGYNRILHTVLRAGFTDAQCGFKAIRTDVVRPVLDEVRDEGWFFDTELLVLAERRGLRIHEVPVDWVDDPDSSVDLVRTATDDLKGVARLLWAAPAARFVAVGLLSTLAYVLLYLALHGPLGAAGANAVALALTAVGNTQANRRFSFGVRGRDRLLRQHLQGALVFLLALGLTSAALHLLHAVDAHPGKLVEAVVLVAASLCATISRYVALRSWIFSRGPEPRRRLAPPRVVTDEP